MSIRQMGIVFDLALIVESILSMFLPESESTIEERLFSEINYQMSELKDVTDHLVHILGRVSGTMQQRDDVTELVTKLSQVRDSVSQSNLSSTQ